MRYVQISDPLWLEKEIENKPLRQIAEEVGCSYSAVVYQVKKHGLTVPQRFTHRPSLTKSENIKKTLRERFPDGRFGENASNWKGGRHKFKTGYIAIHSPGHPRAGRDKRVFEHILVAEKKLGRHLKPGEIVHHINHIKDDNRPENLEVVMRGEHVRNHFSEPIELQKRVAYLEKLLEDNDIIFA